MDKPKKIEDLNELKRVASNENGADCFVVVGGFMRSSKDIYYLGDDQWHIFNSIDDSEVDCSTDELSSKTNILEALEKGCLWKY